MLRRTVMICMFLTCILTYANSSAAEPDKSAELKKLHGRWIASRDVEYEKGKFRRQWVELEFAGNELTIAILNENKKRSWDFTLDVIGVESVNDISRIAIGLNKRAYAEIYYDFVGGKLILTGRIRPRPFEGFSLSGEYANVEKPMP